jgi:hypothetical protein
MLSSKKNSWECTSNDHDWGLNKLAWINKLKNSLFAYNGRHTYIEEGECKFFRNASEFHEILSASQNFYFYSISNKDREKWKEFEFCAFLFRIFLWLVFGVNLKIK